jgi:hypothetical protein
MDRLTDRQEEKPCQKQGDQIGRIFACWAIVYLGQVFENYKSSPNSWAFFVHGTNYAYIFKRFWVTFFTNSSGHPGQKTDAHTDNNKNNLSKRQKQRQTRK